MADHRRRLDRRTIEVARANGVDHIVRLTNNKGLAAAFQAGLDAGLKLGADVIVNTDADNQYEGADIPKLVAPILRGEADMVVGDRQVDVNEHFSALKRRLQRLGSWVVRQASSTEIPDTTSGFRAYNREAALQMQAVSKFTYTLETIIQAGKLLVAVDHVPIRTNPKTRESRLFPSMPAYVRRNALSIFRIYSQYEPLKVFWGGALVMGVAALAFFMRFIVYFVEGGGGAGHVQSLIAGAVLFIARDAARRAGGDRRPAGRPADALAADLRARAADRAAARGRSPRTTSAARRLRRASRRAERPRGARGMTRRRGRGAVPTGNTFDKYGSTNPVVRRLMAGFERTLDELFARPRLTRCSTSAAAKGCSPPDGRSRLGSGPRGRHRPRGPQARGRVGATRRRANLEFRAMERRARCRSPTASSTSSPRPRSSSTSPDPAGRARRDGPRGAQGTCSSRCRASRCGEC